MRKQEFLARLREGLLGLPNEDIEERLTFYSEMIDDRMEEGLSEEDAVYQIGNVDEIISQIVTDTFFTKRTKEKVTPKKKRKAWEIVLLILGSPIWLSLLIAAFAVFVSLYAALWSVIISLWTVFGAVIGCALGGIMAGIGFALNGNSFVGMAMIGAGIVCAGLAILSFCGCKAATKGTLLLTKKIAFGMKKSFMKREEA